MKEACKNEQLFLPIFFCFRKHFSFKSVIYVGSLLMFLNELIFILISNIIHIDSNNSEVKSLWEPQQFLVA